MHGGKGFVHSDGRVMHEEKGEMQRCGNAMMGWRCAMQNGGHVIHRLEGLKRTGGCAVTVDS
jgi:hypothetical protein